MGGLTIGREEISGGCGSIEIENRSIPSPNAASPKTNTTIDRK
jgi:hypothetical protein